MSMPADLCIALWQCHPLPLDVAGNLQRLERQAAIARAQGAELLVCPEMFTSGYDIGVDAATRLAEAADGARAQAIAQIAKRHRIAIAWGYPECDADGAIYNAAQLRSAGGELLARYRKTHLYGDLDRAMFSAGRGDEPTFMLSGWRLGLAICYDIEFPETARRLALAGADLIVVPTANMAEFDVVQQTLLPARAFENQVYLAYANYCGCEGSLHYGGLSCVLAPDGQAPVQAGRDEALLIAELSQGRLAASRRRFTYLADRRADLSSAGDAA